MAIFLDDEDRFKNREIVNYPDGTVAIYSLFDPKILNNIKAKKVLVTRGMSVKTLAYEQYPNDSKYPEQLWWLICYANNVPRPELFDVLLEGQYAYIPDWVELTLKLQTIDNT